MGNRTSCQGKDFVEKWLGFPPASGYNPGAAETSSRMKDQQEALHDLRRRLDEIEKSACAGKRDQRFKLEKSLLGQLEDDGDLRSLNGVVSQRQLLEIFKYDPEFCSENGKLRHLFARQWETQMEINKWRRVALEEKK